MQLSSTAKWILTHTNIDPKKIAHALKQNEQDMWQYLEELRLSLNEMEREREAYLPTMKKELEAMRNEIPAEVRKEFRLNHLQQEYKKAVKKFERLCMDLAKGDTDNASYAEEAEKELRRITAEIKIVQGYDMGISREMIEKAREYPITQLIESKRDVALCPFHNESTPSLYLKNNFYHCFGCGANGDTIDLVMHTRGFTFPQAVEYLNHYA